MCAATPRMRARISFSKPFITDITVMSAAMPSAMPSIETDRDERDEVGAALGAGVAQADEELEGSQGGSRRVPGTGLSQTPYFPPKFTP